MRTRHLSLILLVFFTCFSWGCAKNTKKLQWSYPTEPMLLKIELEEKQLEEELKEALVTLRRVHFALDSTALTPESRQALIDAREKLGDRKDVHLYVEGHADSRGGTEYNISLAEDRATVVCEYLEKLGMQPDRLHVVSWGEEKPLVEEQTEEAFARNRRVDFRVMRGDVEIVLEEGTVVASR